MDRLREHLVVEDEVVAVLAERQRLEGVINVFSNNGIPARLLEGLFLRASAAEQLAAKLEERDRLADRVRELEDKRER